MLAPWALGNRLFGVIVTVVMSGVIFMGDRSGEWLAANHEADSGSSGFLVEVFGQLLARERVPRRLASGLAVLGLGGEFELFWLVAMLHIDGHFGRIGGHGLFGTRVEQVDSDCAGGVIVNDLSVVLFVSEFDQHSMVRALRRMIVFVMRVPMIVLSRSGWHGSGTVRPGRWTCAFAAHGEQAENDSGKDRKRE